MSETPKSLQELIAEFLSRFEQVWDLDLELAVELLTEAHDFMAEDTPGRRLDRMRAIAHEGGKRAALASLPPQVAAVPASELVRSAEEIILHVSGDPRNHNWLREACKEWLIRCYAVTPQGSEVSGRGDDLWVICECGNRYSLHVATVCPKCFAWPRNRRNAQVIRAFDLIAQANGVTTLSLGEMESIVNRALSGEFDESLPAVPARQDAVPEKEQPRCRNCGQFKAMHEGWRWCVGGEHEKRKEFFIPDDEPSAQTAAGEGELPELDITEEDREKGKAWTLHFTQTITELSQMEEYFAGLYCRERQLREAIAQRDEAREHEERIRKVAEASERWRRAYQDGKHSMYEEGGVVADAAFSLLPCNEGQLDRNSRKLLIEPFCAPILLMTLFLWVWVSEINQQRKYRKFKHRIRTNGGQER